MSIWLRRPLEKGEYRYLWLASLPGLGSDYGRHATDVLSPRSKTSDEEKVAAFLKYWDRTNNTTYARMLKTALEDLYGFRDWSVQGILELTGR